MSRTSDQLKESLAHLSLGAAVGPESSSRSPANTTTTTGIIIPMISPSDRVSIGGTASSPIHYEILANVPTAASTTCSTFHSMKYRNLGKSGIKVPLLGLAVWTAFGTRISDSTADEIISMAYDHGVSLFDTGDGFANGRCESLLGSILRRKNWRRSSFLVSSKLFWTSGPSAFVPSPSLSRKFIVEAVQSCLQRLQLSYLDIVVINKLDGMCPMEEIVRSMQHLLDKGLVHYWGTSRWSPVHIMEAFTVARQFNLTPPTLEQMEYHMFAREKMELYMPELYHKLGVGVVSWSPHSVSQDDGIQLISRRSISPEEKAIRAAKQLELNTIATRLGCDSVQLSIAWSLRNEQSNCVLIAPRSPDQLYLHLNALKVLAKLTPGLMEEVESLLANKPAVKRRGASISERSAIIAAAAAAASSPSGAPVTGSISGAAGAPGDASPAPTAVVTSSGGPVQV